MAFAFLTHFFEPKSMAEKRREDRLEAEHQYGVDFETTGAQVLFGQGSGKDISSSGFRFATSSPLKKGQHFQVRLDFPQSFPGVSQISLQAEVVRIYRPKGTRRYRIACRFVNLDQCPEAARTLDEFLWWLEHHPLKSPRF